MGLRKHASQHDRAASLPVIAKRARVSAVESMDENRQEEIVKRLKQLGSRHGFAVGVNGSTVLDWDEIFDRAVNANRRLAPRIGALRDRYERAHPSLLRIEFESDQPFDFAAGQYVSIRYGDRTRAYSLANSPNASHSELCIRRVPDGRLSPRLCDELAVGDHLAVRGPHGDLLLEDRSERDLAFFATGTGVAPMRSMMEYLFEEKHDVFRGEQRDVWLFLGAAWVDDLPYHERFQSLSSTHENFHYVPSVSRESWLRSWAGETEYIQDAMLKYVEERALDDAAIGHHVARFLDDSPTVPIDARIDPHNLEVYTCGINAMVYSLEMAVKRLGVPAAHIHGEGYG